MTMTANDELLNSMLRALGEIDDAELDRRMARFEGALRQLRDDPVEAARTGGLSTTAGSGRPETEIDGPRTMASYETFYRTHYPKLIRYAIYLNAGSIAEAEDAVDSAMISVFQRWAVIVHPHAWARRSIANHLIKEKMRLSRERDVAPDERADTAGQPTLIWEQGRWVEEVLAGLPPGQREVIDMVIDGLTPQEVAVLLGKSPDGVRQNLHAARKRLKRYLAEVEQDWLT
jgi:RNA polymerase sigma factor (sigma-70 family)